MPRTSPAVVASLLAVPLMALLTASPQRSRPVAIQSDRLQPTAERDGPPVIAAPGVVKVGIATPGSPRSYTVREIPLEQYVAGVLVGEAARDSQPAVLQALAVAIRTYALKNLRRHRDEGFDVCDQTHCQVLRNATPITTDAAAKTAGQVLTWNGDLAIVYYSASCGGHSEIPSAVWPGAEDPPYLPARPDDGCGGSPAWSLQLRSSEVERALAESGHRGTLSALRVLSRDSSGRVARFGVDGLTPSVISGQDLRMAVGPTRLKSTALEMRQMPDGYEFSGQGYGHGVGMCVIGATRLAERGESGRELLVRYFPGTTLGVIAAEGVVPVRPEVGPVPVPPAQTVQVRPRPNAAPPVSQPLGSAPRLPPAERASVVAGAAAAGGGGLDDATRSRQQLEAAAVRAHAELSAFFQVTRPAPVLRVQASDVDYERITGRHWFTWGALVGDQLHLMPLPQLVQQGVMERIVRRETVHHLIDAELAKRPRWVRDGLALYYADPQRSETETDPRGACPSDQELTNPLSAGALAQAYGRARACVARQLTSGRSWREVR